jgi:1,2-phenylacetyl-CoA epoxidase PaaB subunit
MPKKPTQKKPTQKKPTQKKPTQWKVYRLKGSPAAFIGTVYAPDEKAALKAAIKEFEITPDQQNRLLIRRA